MVTQPVDIIMDLVPPHLGFLFKSEIDFLVFYIPNDTGNDESAIIVRGDDPQTPEQINQLVKVFLSKS